MPTAPGPGRPGTNDEVIYEMVRLGRLVRVTAMKKPTLVEVVAHGPASAGAATLRRLARDRLAWVLGRRAGLSI
ncbi:MAG TPA: hypothetical protein VFZ01_06810 [Geminicoccaceae bacterium]